MNESEIVKQRRKPNASRPDEAIAGHVDEAGFEHINVGIAGVFSEDAPLSARGLMYLHALAEQGTMRGAADALGVNASVVSRQIALLETRLHAVIVERRGRRVVLSEIGRLLVDFHRDKLHRERELNAQIDAFRSLKRGRIRIGVGEGFVEGLLTVALQTLKAGYPDIAVEMHAAPTADVISMVLDDTVDMGICVKTTHDPAVSARTFKAGPLCAIMHPSHPLAALAADAAATSAPDGTRTMAPAAEGPGAAASATPQSDTMPLLPVAALRGQSLIFMNGRFGVQRSVDAILTEQRMAVTPAYRCDLFASAQALAAAGLGIAFMSARAAQARIHYGELVALPLDHPLAREFAGELVKRVGRRLPPAGEQLWKLLVQVLKAR